MKEQIKFENECWAELKNGTSIQKGIKIRSFVHNKDDVRISSINSKGFETKGFISLPKENIDEFIEILKQYKSIIE